MKKIFVLSFVILGCGSLGHKDIQTSPKINEENTLQTVSIEPVLNLQTDSPKNISTATSTKISTTPTIKTKTVPAPQELSTVFSPISDKPVFKDESLIDLQDRVLNPLAALSPQKDTTSVVPWHGEQLKFGLYYSFIKVGTAYIKNRGLVEIDGHKAYLIQTSAFSASVIDSVFKVRDINLSWLDVTDFYSLGYSQSLREGRYKRDEWVRFNYDTNTYWGKIVKKSGTRELAGEVSGKVLDMLTSLYFVRGQQLKDGKEIIFDILNREKQYPLVVKMIGRETVKTPAGKFKCIIVEPQFRGEGIFVSKGKSLRVWLTDDEQKLPVKMKTEVFVGSVSAELLEYQRN